jgi:eukaryotic-like serine/threonine-protein kinase
MTIGIRPPSPDAISSRYRVLRHLGEGGMATVFLAEDLKHHRKVAIKVLRPELAAILGGQRFLKEIELTANLQHPNILPLYDSGDAEGHLFYVMPFVEGQSLRDRLTSERQLPVEEAVAIARGVAAALQYAHEHGVIHRDIKPENVLLQAGQPVVADFGIALAVSQAGGSRLTETGLSLGTPHYMSPEQASGDRHIDARTDVYSLGAMLYEMLTGEPPYTGSNAQAIVAKILTEDPSPITRTRSLVPGNVVAAVEKALAKSPADRFASAARFAEALTDSAFSTGFSGAAYRSADAIMWRRTATGLGILATALASVAAWGWLRGLPERPTNRYSLSLPNARQDNVGVMLSNDGTMLAYVGEQDGREQIFVRRLDETRWTPVPGTEGARAPFFSPDGTRLGFMSERGGTLSVVSLSSGELRVLHNDIGFFARGSAWGRDGFIYVTGLESRGISRLPDTGGPLQQVTFPDTTRQEARHVRPNPLPNGKGLVFQIRDPNGNMVAVADLESGEYRRLMPGASPKYVEPGYLLYITDSGSLMGVGFDADKLEVTGEPVVLEEGVSPNGVLAISSSGMLLYHTATEARSGLRIVSVDKSVKALSLPNGLHRGLRISPDGRKLLAGRDNRLFVHDLSLGTTVTIAPSWIVYDGYWSRDGRRVGFHSFYQNTLFWDGFDADAEGTGVPRQQFRLADVEAGIAWTSGGQLLARGFHAGGRGHDVYLISFVRDSVRLEPLLKGDWNETMARLSEDESWLAYVSDETGRDEVYVRPFPDVAAGSWKISERGGREPVWARDGRTLFYWEGNILWAAHVRPAGGFSVVRRETVLTDDFYAAGGCCTANYDVTPEGGLIYARRLDGSRSRVELMLVDNFLVELKRKVAR